MSAPAVAVPAGAPQPAPVRRLPARARRGSAPARPRLTGPPGEHLTVTITIAAGDPDHRDRVLAALGDLIEAAAAPTTGSSGAPAAGFGAAGENARPTSAVGRRPGVLPQPSGAARTAPVPSVCLDLGPRTVARGGRPIELSRREFDLLAFLVGHPRRVFDRTQLLRQVWGEVRSGQRTVDVHIARLRRKVGGEVITTVRGVGYRLADDAAIAVSPR